MKKLIFLISFLVASITVTAQQNVFAKDVYMSGRMLISTNGDTLIAPDTGLVYLGDGGWYFSVEADSIVGPTRAYGIAWKNSTAFPVMGDLYTKIEAMIASGGYDSLRFDDSDNYLRGYTAGSVVDSTLIDEMEKLTADTVVTDYLGVSGADITLLGDSLLIPRRAYGATWETSDAVPAMGDLWDQFQVVDDSLGRHTDNYYTLQDSVINNIDSITKHSGWYYSLRDSVIANIDSLERHTVDYYTLQDSVINNMDSIVNHTVRYYEVLDSIARHTTDYYTLQDSVINNMDSIVNHTVRYYEVLDSLARHTVDYYTLQDTVINTMDSIVNHTVRYYGVLDSLALHRDTLDDHYQRIDALEAGGGGFWSQTGNYLYPKTLTDSIGIGNDTPTEMLDVTGKGLFSESLTAAELVIDNLNLNGNTLTSTGTFVLSAADQSIDLTIGTGASDDFTINTDGLIYEGDTKRVGMGITSPDGKLHLAESAKSTLMYIDTYSETNGDNSSLYLSKSASASIGTKLETATGENLGIIHFQGVDSGNNFDDGAVITATQNGAAGTRVPTDMSLYTYSSTAANVDQLFLSNVGWVSASDSLLVPDVAYGSSWNNSTGVPTKNSLWDKFESIHGSGYDSVAFSPVDNYWRGYDGALVSDSTLIDEMEYLTVDTLGFGDLDTYIAEISDDSLGFFTAGVRSATIEPDQDWLFAEWVGVGASPTQAKLQITGSGAYNASTATRFDLLNSIYGASWYHHVGDAGVYQIGNGAASRVVLYPTANGNIDFYNGSGLVNFIGSGASSFGGNVTLADQLAINTTINAGYQMELQVDDADNKSGLLIDMNETGSKVALNIDSESSSTNALSVTGKFPGLFEQDISGGYGIIVQRNIAEAGSLPLVRIYNFNAANTQPSLYVSQYGTGDILQLYDGAVEVFSVADGGNITQGGGVAGIDYTYTWNGETNDLVETWYEDENYLGLSGGLLLEKGAQNYLFTDRGQGLAIQGQSTGVSSVYNFYTNDGDTSDDLFLRLWAQGTPTATTNTDYLTLGFNNATSEWWVKSEEDGTGTIHDIVLFTENTADQLKLSAVGWVSVSDSLLVPDVAYNATTWNNSTGVATKNALRDKFESITGGGVLPVGTEGQTLYNNGGTWTANDNLFYDDVNNRVGIGGVAPTRPLSVYNTSDGSVANFLSYTDPANFQGLYIGVSQATDVVTFASSGTDAGAFEFTGNVGINDATPTEGTLTVGGTIYSTDNITSSKSGANTMTIESNTDNSYLYIDSNEDGVGTEVSGIILQDNNSEKWQIYKDTGNDFGLYDNTRGADVIKIVDNGDMDLMPTSGGINIGNATGAIQLNNSFTFGTGAAGVDYTITANGETTDGFWQHMEDEGTWYTASKVGIGTNNPTGDFTIQSTSSDVMARFLGTATGGAYVQWTENGVRSWFVGIDDGDQSFKIRDNGIAGTTVLELNENEESIFSGDILTNSDGSSDIGADATRWKAIYADTVHASVYAGSDFVLGEVGSKITSNADSLLIHSTGHDGSGLVNIFTLKTDQNTADDGIGMNFTGLDSGDDETVYANFFANIADPTAGAEDGGFAIKTLTNAVLTEKVRWEADGDMRLGFSTGADSPVDGTGYLRAKAADSSLYWVKPGGEEFDLTASGGGSGDLLADGSVPLTANWDVGAFTITGTQFISDIAIGTAPFVVTSTTLVSNLNADLLDGQEGSYYGVGTSSTTEFLYNNAGATDGVTNVTSDGTDLISLDAGKLYFGTDKDAYIDDTGSIFNIQGGAHQFAFGNTSTSDEYMVFQYNAGTGYVNLNYNGATKFYTTSTGATVTGQLSVSDEVYGAGWDASLQVPTKNAVYDKIETLTTDAELAAWTGTTNIVTVGTISVNSAYTLPAADGGSSTYLQTDGAGNLSWAAASGTGVAADDNVIWTGRHEHRDSLIMSGSYAAKLIFGQAGAGQKMYAVSSDIRIADEATGYNVANFDEDGSIFYYNNAAKLTIATDGISVTGDATISADINMGDNDKVILGDGQDLQIYHDPADANTIAAVGLLEIYADDIVLTADGETGAASISIQKDGSNVETIQMDATGSAQLILHEDNYLQLLNDCDFTMETSGTVVKYTIDGATGNTVSEGTIEATSGFLNNGTSGVTGTYSNPTQIIVNGGIVTSVTASEPSPQPAPMMPSVDYDELAKSWENGLSYTTKQIEYSSNGKQYRVVITYFTNGIVTYREPGLWKRCNLFHRLILKAS